MFQKYIEQHIYIIDNLMPFRNTFKFMPNICMLFEA